MLVARDYAGEEEFGCQDGAVSVGILGEEAGDGGKQGVAPPISMAKRMQLRWAFFTVATPPGGDSHDRIKSLVHCLFRQSSEMLEPSKSPSISWSRKSDMKSFFSFWNFRRTSP